jgi:hypothetical protein
MHNGLKSRALGRSATPAESHYRRKFKLFYLRKS